MTTLQYFFPDNRLAKALKEASPRSVRQSLQEAEENLKDIGPQCAEHLDRILGALEIELGRWPETANELYLGRLYQLALRMIGVAAVAGLQELDCAAGSLCDVIDSLAARGTWDKEPVAVHISSMRLLRSTPGLGQGASRIVEGLLKVRQRFVDEQGIAKQANARPDRQSG